MTVAEAIRPDIQVVQSEDVERCEAVSVPEFVREYRNPRVPVILTDATSNWGARRWTPALLRERVGSRIVTVRREDGNFCYGFDELTDLILSSTPDAPAPYGRNLNINHDLPELLADVQPRLKYARPDWKSSRLLPKNWLFPNGLEELFFGGPGNQFPYLHIDYFGMDGFVSQLYGEKEFVLFAPKDTPFLYPSRANPLKSQIDDIENPDVGVFPLFARATPLHCVLQPGETLYLPNGWWHTTRMKDVSITVITATWNASNWNTLVGEIWRTRNRVKPLKAALSCAYLKLVGSVLGLRERIQPLA